MYDQPERVAERVSLSMSLIDQDHTGTWGEAGLIIEAPEENIVLTSETDAGSHNNHLEFLLKQGQRQGVMNSDDLLACTSPHSYNEVVAVADHDGSQLQLKGFFYKVTSKGKPIDRNLANKMQMHANRLGLPIVEIPIANPNSENKVERYIPYGSDTECVAVNFNGNRHLVSGFEDMYLFKTYDEAGISHFTEPHEFEAAVGYAVSSGNMSEDEAKKALDTYADADKKRRTPTAEFDEDGSLIHIVYYEGYGDNEYEMRIGKSGHGYRTNTKLMGEKIRESMLNPRRTQMTRMGEDRSQTPIDLSTSDEMIAKACESLGPVRANQIQQWYREHRSVLEKQWEYHVQMWRSLGGIGLISGF